MTGRNRQEEAVDKQATGMQEPCRMFIVQGEARDDSGDMQNGQEKAGDRQEWTGDRMKLPRKDSRKDMQERDGRQTIYRQKTGGMIQETCRMGRRRQETDRNGQEEAGDRQEWAGGGRRQTGMGRRRHETEGMGRRRQETDRNGQEEAGDRTE